MTQRDYSSFPWIISSGTLRSENLLPRFWCTAESLGATIPPDVVSHLERLVGADSKESDWDDELAFELVEILAGILQEQAPNGFYFGSNEGDGACYGFWLNSDWAAALQSVGLDFEDPETAAQIIDALDDLGIDTQSLEDAYCGTVDALSAQHAGREYAQQTAEDCGMLPDYKDLRWPLTCIDWDAAWRELEIGDGYAATLLGNGLYLITRNV